MLNKLLSYNLLHNFTYKWSTCLFLLRRRRVWYRWPTTPVPACSRNHIMPPWSFKAFQGSSSKVPAFSLEVLVRKNYSLGFSVWYIHTAHYTSIAFINRSYLVSLFYFQLSLELQQYHPGLAAPSPIILNLLCPGTLAPRCHFSGVTSASGPRLRGTGLNCDFVTPWNRDYVWTLNLDTSYTNIKYGNDL